MKTTTTIIIIDESTAIATKKFLKQAMVYGTEEYKIMRTFKIENPGVKVVAKQIKKNPDKETNKNMTYENMRLFIKTLPNNTDLLAGFELQIERSCIKSNRYRYVLDWFKENCLNSEEATKNFNNIIVPTEEKTTTPALMN